MDAERAEHQLRLIADTVAMAERLGAPVWLRGGWAMDFVLGQVTRDHVDIDWVALIDDAPAISAALSEAGYQTITGPPPDQQLDVAKDGESRPGGAVPHTVHQLPQAGACQAGQVVAGMAQVMEMEPDRLAAFTASRQGLEKLLRRSWTFLGPVKGAPSARPCFARQTLDRTRPRVPRAPSRLSG